MFTDRKDAAQKLASALERYKGKDVLVLGIPRGGVETAYYVATHLDATFSLLVARKLGHPGNPEFAVGAIAEDGTVYLPESGTRLPEKTIRRLIDEQKIEIDRRIRTLRHGDPLPEIKGRTVILVDDGIATGATIFAAVRLCRKQGAGKIIVAAPVASSRMIKALLQEADEAVVLERPLSYFSVSEFYSSFNNLSDQEARSFLERWKTQEQRLSGQNKQL